MRSLAMKQYCTETSPCGAKLCPYRVPSEAVNMRAEHDVHILEQPGADIESLGAQQFLCNAGKHL